MSALLFLTLLASDPAATLRAQDATLARVGYRLTSRGAPICRADGHSTGLVIERLSQYSVADRSGAGVGPLPTVTSVVPGSPAATADLRAGDQIAMIEGAVLTPEDPAFAPVDYGPTGAVRTQLAAALADGSATLAVVAADGTRRTLTVVAPPDCDAEFLVRGEGKLNSYSNGHVVQITSGVMTFCRTDAELAAVVAHELAHNILRHPQTLKAQGRPRKLVRETEAAADRLSVYLLALAGYSFQEALALRDRIGRRTDWGFLSDGTHPGRKETLALMTAEHVRIEAQLARGKPIRPPADLLPPR